MIDDSLEAKECNYCHGIWIPGYNYMKFLERRPSVRLDPQDIQFKAISVQDSAPGKVCPDCGKAIIAREIGFGLDLFVERCDTLALVAPIPIAGVAKARRAGRKLRLLLAHASGAGA